MNPSAEDPHAALRRLIAPVEPGRFYTEYWESKPLVIRRQRPDAFAGLLSLDEVDRVVTSMQLVHPEVQAVDATKTLRPEDYTFPGGVVDPTRLFQLFADGATIILPQLDQRVPALAELVSAMERELNQRLQTNIYVTPGNAQGFKTHYDSHDVFILQVVGHKHWVLYDTPVELPYRNQRFVARQHPAGNVTQEFDMEPGDVAYIPRGVMHDAATTGGTTSVHVTLGVLAVSWTDLMVEALARVGMRDPTFRRALPPGFARQGFARDDARALFRELWKRASESAGFDDALDFFADDFRSTRHPRVGGQLAQVDKLRTLSPASRAGARPNLLYLVNDTPEHAVLECFGASLKFPLHVGEPLRAALASEDFVVGELPGALDDAGKLVLVRRLVREGLVRLL